MGNMNDPSLILILLFIGGGTGILTGLTGASGMSVLISGLLLAGFEIREVIGLTFAVTFFNSAAALPPYLKKKCWDPRVTWAVGLSACATVVIGHNLGRATPSTLLSGVVVAALFLAGLHFLFKKKTGKKEALPPRKVPLLILILLGGVLGTIMGIMGGGGSVFINLLLIFLCRLPLRVALGSSIIIIALAALPGIFLNFQADQLDLFSAVCLIIPGITTAYLSSKWAHKVPERKIQIIMGSYLVLISLVLFYTRIFS